MVFHVTHRHFYNVYTEHPENHGHVDNLRKTDYFNKSQMTLLL